MKQYIFMGEVKGIELKMKKAEKIMKNLNIALFIFWALISPEYLSFSVMSSWLYDTITLPLLEHVVSLIYISPAIAIICLVFSIINYVKQKYKKALIINLIPIIYPAILFGILILFT